MNANQIKELLDRMAEYHAEGEAVKFEKQKLIDQIMTPEIKARIAEVDLEFADKFEAMDDKIAALAAAINQAVIANGASVKGEFLHAVFMGGRVSWDTKGLEAFITANPKYTAMFEKFKKTGAPSVSLRAAK